MDIKTTEKYKTLKELMESLIDKGQAKNLTEARKVAQNTVPKEAVYQAAVLRYLKTLPKTYAWKDQAGPYQQKGLPDVCAIIDGKFYGFEVKRPFFGQPTEIQLQTHKKMREAGATVHVVSYVSEVKEIIGEGAKE